MFLNQDDKTLIAKALNGSQSAWCKLVKRHEKALYGYTLRMTNNQADALDLMQETFMSVCRNLADFKQQSSFKTWLLSMAYYKCMDFYRRKKVAIHDGEEPDDIESDGSIDCPAINLEQLQDSEGLRLLLSALSFEQKLIVELKIFQQLTFEQIADQMGLSSNTVKSKFYASLAKLKQLLKGSDYAA